MLLNAPCHNVAQAVRQFALDMSKSLSWCNYITDADGDSFCSSTMGDDMDDGIGPELCDQGGLGYVPQRRNLTNNLLPYADQLDVEIVTQLKAIKRNLINAVLQEDIRHGTLYWLLRLQR